MELGSINNRAYFHTWEESTQIIQNPREKVEVEVVLDSMGRRWNCTLQELVTLKERFLNLWGIKDPEQNSYDLAEEQLSLLKDMDEYPDLRAACFQVMITKSSECDEKVFDLFLGLQDYIFESMSLGLDPVSGTAWHGRIFQKNGFSLKKLIPQYKSQPYISLSNNSLRDLNNKVCFLPQKPGDSVTEKILCRHLATQFVKDAWEEKSGKGKVNMAHYSSEETLAQHISRETEDTHKILRNTANRYILINNDELGEHLVARFEDMRRPEKNETLRLLTLESTNHCMGLRLRMKGTKEHPVFVITFYDPNKTDVTVRCEANQLSTFKTYSLKQFLNGIDSNKPAWYEHYYKGMEPISVLAECNLVSFTKNVAKDIKILENFTVSEVTPTHICLLVWGNFAKDLIGLRNKFEEIGENSYEELLNLLTAKRKGEPGLFKAMAFNYPDIVNAYREILQSFKEIASDKLIDLLIAKTSAGTPGLYIALQDGHADAIEAYGELLKLFPQSEYSKLTDLLDAKNATGMSGLGMALGTGHAHAIKAYGKLLKLFPEIDPSKLVELLTAKLAKAPGLFKAMQNGHADAIEAYGELLKLFPEIKFSQLADLLAAKTDEVPGLYIALEVGDAGVVKAYGNLLKLFPKIGTNKLVDLLTAKKDEVPGLYMALETGHIGAVKAYGDLLKLFPDIASNKLVDLLAAKAEEAPGLCVALQNGHAATVIAYMELLKLFPEIDPGKLVDLIAAKTEKGTPGLYLALLSGHPEAITAYGELLRMLPEIKRHKLIQLLAAKSANGTSGLFIALHCGHTDAITAYEKLFQLLDDKEREQLLDLLEETTPTSTPWLFQFLSRGHREVTEDYKKLRQLVSTWRAEFITKNRSSLLRQFNNVFLLSDKWAAICLYANLSYEQVSHGVQTNLPYGFSK
ncbi:MAG: ShET2/EspL2 family type secretion system effector toxin [Solimicrobium sp.]|jgi:tetratricopeptide (TPR) repeat protein|nr:ShET2/EspL2 family type secretion system effector toxin [Solimicrobium sp.]